MMSDGVNARLFDVKTLDQKIDQVPLTLSVFEAMLRKCIEGRVRAQETPYNAKI